MGCGADLSRLSGWKRILPDGANSAAIAPVSSKGKTRVPAFFSVRLSLGAPA
jgi:hypothetical protein